MADWQERVLGLEADAAAAEEQLRRALEAGTSEDESFFSDASHPPVARCANALLGVSRSHLQPLLRVETSESFDFDSLPLSCFGNVTTFFTSNLY